MPLLVIGLNHRSAPVALLERLAVPADAQQKALTALLDLPHVTEAVVLSTCNRVEVYANVTRYHGGMADLRTFLAEWGGLGPEDFAHLAYDHFDAGAARHLFAVAAGLDSMVVGERQIHLQVRQAFHAALEEGACGTLLNRVFRQAVRVGRRVRSETTISEGAATIVDVGLQAATTALGDLHERHVVVVGAGKIGGMGARRMADATGRLTIVNRDPERGAALAARVGAAAAALDDLPQVLLRADLVITTTDSMHPLLDHATVADAVAARAGRPLVLLDLAVPRDVDPRCADLDGVTIIDIDALRKVVTGGPTREALAAAEALIEDEAAKLAAWHAGVAVKPTIAALRRRAEDVRQAELERLSSRLSGLDPRDRETVEIVTRGIVNTLLHEPTVRLKALGDGPEGPHHAAALRELFALDEDGDG